MSKYITFLVTAILVVGGIWYGYESRMTRGQVRGVATSSTESSLGGEQEVQPVDPSYLQVNAGTTEQSIGASSTPVVIADNASSTLENDPANVAVVTPTVTPSSTVIVTPGSTPASQQNNSPKAHKNFLTPEGLDITVLREGVGTRQVEVGDTVKVTYSEILNDGSRQKIDPAHSGRSPYIFQIGSEKVIDGWNKAIIGMKINEVREVIIPADLAYGEAGNAELGVPPQTSLRLCITLAQIN